MITFDALKGLEMKRRQFLLSVSAVAAAPLLHGFELKGVVEPGIAKPEVPLDVNQRATEGDIWIDNDGNAWEFTDKEWEQADWFWGEVSDLFE